MHAFQPEPPKPSAAVNDQTEKKESESSALSAFAAVRGDSQTFAHKFQQKLADALKKGGYLPPEPPPLLRLRTVRAVAHEERAHDALKMHDTDLRMLEARSHEEAKASVSYLKQLMRSLESQGLQGLFDSVLGTKQVKQEARVSMDMPVVSNSLQAKLAGVERFLSECWASDEARATVAVHTDEKSNTTVIQLGIAKHGPIYVSIPRILKPENAALRALRVLLRTMEPFRSDADPLAVINGEYQSINFSEIFTKSRVVRAPSGNVQRLQHNLAIAMTREQLMPENTSIINSSPRTQAEYLRMFPTGTATDWAAWSREASAWNQVTTTAGFSTTPEASQAAFIKALAETKNVIVITAHCDGQSLFMPEPPPDGTKVTAKYLLEHKVQIAANAPFVYLFSCHGGDLSNLQNFASTLLECGASGVIAAQGQVPGPVGQLMLGRLLASNRRAPPITDFQNAARELNLYDMEAYIG